MATIVKGWRGMDAPSRLERDLVLEELRHIYDAVLDYESGESEESTEEESVATDSVVETYIETKRDIVDDFDDALDIDALLGLTESDIAEHSPTPEPEPEPEPAHAPAPAPDPEPAPEPAPEPDPAKAVVVEAQRPSGLFDLDDIPVRTKSSRKMISLYNDAPKRESVVKIVEQESKPEPKPEPKVERVEAVVRETIVEEPSKRVGDVLGSNVTTLADAMAGDDAPTTPFNRITDLRKAIGLNDKFLMIRDLFAGDAARYEATIDTLNEFEDLDECMIYIVENFRWNPDSEGAKFLVSLLERKLA